MNKQKYKELVQKKLMLENRIAALKEHQRRNSLSFLIEDTIEKAEIVLAAKAIVDKVGKMAEDSASVEADDLMPMIDSLKSAFGAQMASTFQSTVADQCRSLTATLTQTKDAISSAVSKLEAVANGNAAPNDMATDPMNDAPAGDPNAPDMGMGDDLGDMGEPDLGALGADGGDGGDPLADEGEGPLGRVRKESARRRGKPLNEGLLDSIKGVLTAHFDDVSADRSPREQLEALKSFITAADYEVAAQFPDSLLASIFDRDDAAVGISATPVGELDLNGGIGGMSNDMDGMDDMGAVGVEIEDGAGLDSVPALPAPTAIKPSHLGAVTTTPSITDESDKPYFHDTLEGPPGPSNDMEDDFEDDFTADDLDDDLSDDPLDMPFESANSPARRLRESKNPDAVIYDIFSRVVKEGFARRASARKVAEKFNIDYSDVVSVIKEAEAVKKSEIEANRAGRDWKRIYKEAKEDGLTRSAIITLIRESSVDRRDESTIRSWIVESEKQDAIFGKKKDKKKDDCDTDDDCDDKEKVDEAAECECSKCKGSGKCGKTKCSTCDGTGKDKRKVEEKARTRRSLDSLEREAAYGKKIKLDKNIDKKKEEPKKVEEANLFQKWRDKKRDKESARIDQKKQAAISRLVRDGADRFDAEEVVGAQQKFSSPPANFRRVEEAEKSDCEHEVVWINKDNKSETNTLKSKAAADKFAAQIKQGGAKAASVRVKKVKVDEAEGDTGFNSVTKAGYPEASAPAFRSNSGKGGKGTDKSEKPMVVGGSINPKKGNPAQAGRMAGKGSKTVEEGQDDVTGLPTAPNRDRGFPEATNPAFKKNTKQSGKSDSSGKSPVVGGNKDGKKGNPSNAGRMSESAVVKKKSEPMRRA